MQTVNFNGLDYVGLGMEEVEPGKHSIVVHPFDTKQGFLEVYIIKDSESREIVRLQARLYPHSFLRMFVKGLIHGGKHYRSVDVDGTDVALGSETSYDDKTVHLSKLNEKARIEGEIDIFFALAEVRGDSIIELSEDE
jgi:hypothetical protein